MKNKICLVIVFNHRYDKNLPLLRKIYGSRFSTIRFLVPFYDGTEDDVVAVYESSYQFQGFFAQAREKLLNTGADYFFIIADDLILNPILNENNVLDELGIIDGECLITEAAPMRYYQWPKERYTDAENTFTKQNHTKYQSELKTKESAYSIMAQKGYSDFKVKEGLRDKILKLYMFHNADNVVIRVLKREITKPYPLLAGYSDWFVISRNDFEVVSRKLGVTAAMGLFVEIAIPTIIMLYCNKVKFLTSTKYSNGAMWSRAEIDGLKNCMDSSIEQLTETFPKEKLYIHPVKLSEWN